MSIDIEDALKALMSYQQADMEGVMVLTSRQAIHEVHDAYRRLSAATPSADISEIVREMLDYPAVNPRTCIMAVDDYLDDGYCIVPAAAMRQYAEALQELELLFELQSEADRRAVVAWKAAHPDRPLTSPDRCDMVVWLMEELAHTSAETERAVAAERERCAEIAASGAKQCTEGDTNWHQGFRYAASNTAAEIAYRIRPPVGGAL